MSIIPEIIIQTVINRGIKLMRDDSRFIDQLFVNTSRSDKQNIRDFVKNNTFDLSINYPRSALALPAIVVLLKGETEANAYLGGSMGHQTPDDMSYDDDIPEILGGTASTSSQVGSAQIVYGPFRVLSATNNTVRASDRTFEVDEFVGKEYTLRVVGGTGKGQIRTVSANGHNFIMVSSNWLTLPDTTSILEIHEADSDVIGEPEKLYNRRDPYEYIERRGSLYTLNYQLQVITAGQEQTIYLYAIIKAIMTISAVFLEGQGIINMRMSGSDFSNRPDYVPDVAYMRVLTMQFEAPFDVYQAESEVARIFQISLLDEESEVINEFEVDASVYTTTISGP